MARYGYVPYHSITFYMIDFPNLDPNVPQAEQDIIADGNVIAKSYYDNFKVVVDEARDIFGEYYIVKTKDYDYDLIREEFELEGKIRKNGKATVGTSFTDGKTSVLIPNHVLKEDYMKDVEEKKCIYHQKILIENVVHPELFQELAEDFAEARNIFFQEGDILQLSLAQIRNIQKYVPEVDFLKHYNSENGGNIFVQWGNPSWHYVDKKTTVQIEPNLAISFI